MRKSAFMNKVRSLQKGASRRLVSKCEEIFDSGILNTKEYADDYRLPRVILSIVLFEWYKQVSPIHMADEKRILKMRNVGKRVRQKSDVEKMLETIYIGE